MPDSTIPEFSQPRALDRGPLYTETPVEIREQQPFNGAIAEPWNAATAFLFVIIVLAWLVRLRGRLRQYPFLMVTLPILLVGGIGGTLYHGLRSWVGYFLMDVIPIQLLGLGVSVYWWIRLGPKLRHFFAMLGVLGLLMLLGQMTLPQVWAINVSYAGLALIVLVPLMLVLVRTGFRHAGWVATALVSFAIAWFCRLADAWDPPLLPMGTHWLWHTFGAATTAALSEYVYRIEGLSLRRMNPPSAADVANSAELQFRPTT
jgi:hypothetical protein